MSRESPTWFGIKLSHKQATNVFIISLVGIFFFSMVLVPLIFSFIISIRSAIMYDYMGDWLEYTLIYMLPILLILISFLNISIYSLVKSRRIARSYSDLINLQNKESRPLMFCPNCGNKRFGMEKFCRMCGEELK